MKSFLLIPLPLVFALGCATAPSSHAPAQGVSAHASSPDRQPASMVFETLCKGKFIYVVNYHDKENNGWSVKLDANGEIVSFPYLRALEEPGRTRLWVAADGSYLQTQFLTRGNTNFAIFYSARTGRTQTSLMQCADKVGGESRDYN